MAILCNTNDYFFWFFQINFHVILFCPSSSNINRLLYNRYTLSVTYFKQRTVMCVMSVNTFSRESLTLPNTRNPSNITRTSIYAGCIWAGTRHNENQRLLFVNSVFTYIMCRQHNIFTVRHSSFEKQNCITSKSSTHKTNKSSCVDDTHFNKPT